MKPAIQYIVQWGQGSKGLTQTPHPGQGCGRISQAPQQAGTVVGVGTTELHEVLGQLAQARGQHKDSQQPGSCILQAV